LLTDLGHAVDTLPDEGIAWNSSLASLSTLLSSAWLLADIAAGCMISSHAAFMPSAPSAARKLLTLIVRQADRGPEHELVAGEYPFEQIGLTPAAAAALGGPRPPR